MSHFSALITKAIIAASTLTGKKFGLLVASSIVATSAVVASAVINPEGGLSPLAALVGRSLAADAEPEEVVEEEPLAESAPAPSPGSSTPSGSPVSSPSESAPAPAPAPAPEEEEPAPEPAAEESAPVGPVKHLFVVSLTSPGYDAAFGETTSQMPYLNTELRPQGQLLTGYSLLTPNTAPNGIAALSGQKPKAASKADCPTFGDCVFPVETYTVADQLTVSQRPWSAFIEGMADAGGKPASCVYPGAEEAYAPVEGGYAPQRNPFVFFHSLLDLGDCSANNKPLTELDASLKQKADKAPTVTWIVPNVCNSGATVACPEGKAGGPAAADTFLKEWGQKVLASPAFKDEGMLIVTFDQLDAVPVEGVTAPTGDAALKVGTLLVSRFNAPGSTDEKPYDPYSMLHSTEELFGLGYLGEADSKKTKSFVKPLFGSASGD